MAGKRDKPEDIVLKLRQVEVLQGQGTAIVDAVREIGATQQTYYRWRKQYGGMSRGQFKRLKELEAENQRLRRAVSDLTLPALELRDHEAGRYRLHIGPGLPGFGHVMIGLLRAMADDYGALVMLEHRGSNNRRDLVDITLVESAFAQGRAFDLGASAG